jgi:hypothetical protein
MPNPNSPFGLRPIRYRNGSPYTGAAETVFIPSSYATALFIGDPVIKVAAGSNTAAVEAPAAGTFPIGTLPSVQKAVAGDTNAITGVIVGFAALPTNLEVKHNPASTDRIAYVVTDPEVVYEIQADGAVAAATMGLNANVIFTQSGSAVSGLSGVELNSATPAATATFQLKLVRASSRIGNDTTLTRALVEVMINNSTEAHAVAGI